LTQAFSLGFVNFAPLGLVFAATGGEQRGENRDRPQFRLIPTDWVPADDWVGENRVGEKTELSVPVFLAFPVDCPPKIGVLTARMASVYPRGGSTKEAR